MWKEINGYHGKYLVSDKGEILSVARVKSNNQPVPERMMKQSLDNAGYKYVSLYNAALCKGKRHRVHRIVAAAFIENSESKRTVNHKNGVKADNNLDNLEWATYGENKSHSFSSLGEVHYMKGVFGKDNPHSKEVIQLSLEGIELRRFESATQVNKILGFSQGNVSSVCRGSRNSANGYKWMYSNG